MIKNSDFLIFRAVLLILFFLSLFSFPIKSVAVTKKKVSKEIIFDDQIVNGKYQVPGEGLVTVENEKKLINVLSIRVDFSDRIKNEETRR